MIVRYKLNPFKPGITKVNVIPVLKTIAVILNIKKFNRFFCT